MIALLYDFITVFLLALSCVLSISALILGNPAPLPAVVTTLFSSIICVLLFRLKTRGRIVVSGILAATAGGAIFSAERGTRMVYVRNHLWVAAILIGCVLIVLFTEAVNQNRKLRMIPVIAGTGVLLGALLFGIPMSKNTVLVILACIVLSLAELAQYGWHKEGDTDPKAHVVFSCPVIAVLFILLGMLKMPAVPYDWKFVKDMARDIHSGYEYLMESLHVRENWDEEDASVGFSETSQFFANLRTSSYKVLEVISNLPAGEQIYLCGKTFDTFDGRGWIKRDDSAEKYRLYDILETAAAAEAFDPGNSRNYLRSAGLQIEFGAIRSRHVFAPMKTVPRAVNSETEEIGGDLMFEDSGRRKYNVLDYRMNRGYAGMQELLRQDSSRIEAIDAETFRKAKALLAGEDLSGITPDGLAALRERIHAVYGERPTLSEDVRDYLNRNLDDLMGDYETLVRIEELLSSMNYTASPGELPEEVDSADAFLKYFLLERREGYGTHYATAFVLLARAAGIPARYVQGYCFFLNGGSTQVLSDYAHAWPEAYLDGIGWIAFEPSPGAEIRSGWPVKNDRETEEDEEDQTSYYAEQYGRKQTNEEDEKPAEINAAKRPDFRKLYIPLVLAALFLAAFIPADLFLRKLRYAKMTGREKIVYRFEACGKLLKSLGFAMKEGETLSEFKTRAAPVLGKEYLKFIEVYEAILYGEREITESDIHLLETAEKELRRFWLRRMTGRERNGRY